MFPTRIDHQAGPWNARSLTGFDALFQPVEHIKQHVLVVRLILHGLGVALGMHENNRGLKFSGDAEVKS